MRRLLLVSNRLPVTFRMGADSIEIAPSTGGVATGSHAVAGALPPPERDAFGRYFMPMTSRIDGRLDSSLQGHFRPGLATVMVGAAAAIPF
jgi:hypothetical protein